MEESVTREKEVYDSPASVYGYLDNITSFIQSNLDEIHSIRIVERCCNCLKRVSDTEVIFNDTDIHIKGYTSNCSNNNTKNYIDYKYGYNSVDDVVFKLTEEDDHYYIYMKIYDMFNTKLRMSNYYGNEDYEVHGEYVYKDRNITVKTKEYDDKLIIASQDFIDFKGLRPMYNHLMIINYKTEE